MPAAHRAQMEWSPQRLIHWGQSMGPASAEVVTRLLNQYKHRWASPFPSAARRSATTTRIRNLDPHYFDIDATNQMLAEFKI